MQELIAKTLEVPDESVDNAFVKLMNQKAGGIPMYLSSMASWLKEKKMVKKMMMARYIFMESLRILNFQIQFWILFWKESIAWRKMQRH